MRQLVAACLLAAAIDTLLLRAQAPVDQGPPTAFEVASIKPNKSGDGRMMLGMPPTGRFTATNVPARVLIRQAYEVQEFQITGGPDWLASDRFDIVAKVPEGSLSGGAAGVPPVGALRPMLRSLLADRFKLVTHTETKEMPIYALVLARPDGRLGPNLKTAKTDCAAVFRGRRGGGPPPPLPQPGQPIDCGFMMGFGTMNAGGMGIIELARTLSQQLDRIVIDKTGLTATYDFTLSYQPEGRGGFPPPPGGLPPVVNGATIDPNAPTLFTALQEQLGLKLESQRGPVEVLVIDRIERPTED